MTKRRKRRARVVREEPEEVLGELENNGDFEDESEEDAPSPPKRKRRKVVESEPEDEKDPPKRRKRKTTRKVEDVEPEPVSSEDLLNCLLEGLDEGQSMTITREGDASWALVSGAVVSAAPAAQKLSGKAYRDEVRSQEFRDHQAVWKELSFEEKVAQAEKLGVEWAEHDDPRVEVMGVTVAVRKKLGIEKYKPQYRTRAARAAIRA